MSKKAIFDQKNILVTGGAGFVGSHLCDELVKNNKVICVDDFSTGDEKNIDHLLDNPNFEFIRHDMAKPIDLESLQELKKFKIEFQGIQEIYHLACPTSPMNFDKNIIATLDASSLVMKNVLDMAVKYSAKILHFSSSVVYGPRRNENQKISEDDIGLVDMLSERGSYDEGKRFAETMVINYKRFYNIDAKIFRLFRIYGPRMSINDGQMIPDFITNALDNKDLEIFGDQTFSSSLCYVSDVVDASTKIMATDLFGPYNLGSDVEINLTEVASKIINMIGSKSNVVYKDKMLFMTPLCLPNISKIRNELGWMPIVTLENGLKKTIDDLRASKGLKSFHQSI